MVLFQILFNHFNIVYIIRTKIECLRNSTVLFLHANKDTVKESILILNLSHKLLTLFSEALEPV